VFAVHGSRILTAGDRDVVAYADVRTLRAACACNYAPRALLDLRDGTGRTHRSRRHCCWIYRQSRVCTCPATRPPTASVLRSLALGRLSGGACWLRGGDISIAVLGLVREDMYLVCIATRLPPPT